MNRNFLHKEVIGIIGGTAGILMAAVFSGFPLAAAVLPGLVLLSGIAFRKGYSPRQLFSFSWSGIKMNLNVALLLVFIGIILPSWHLSGTIEHLNKLFLSFIRPEYFFTTAFLSGAVMSLIIGSAIGSLSIVGLPVMAAAEVFGLPVPLIAGALVSGAFVGDRTSPLSSAFQLLSFSLELEQGKQLKAIIPTMIISAGLTGGIFLILDGHVEKGTALLEAGLHDTGTLFTGEMVISLIPPVVLSGMIMFGHSMKKAFLAGILSSLIILLLRGVYFPEWVYGSIFGIGTHGGLRGMFPFIIFILIVGAYCQVLEDTGLMKPYIRRIFSGDGSLFTYTIKTLFVAAGVSLISPNQSFPILLTGRSLLPFWQTRFSTQHLARILSDSTIVFAGLIPWSLLAILCSTILQVPVLSYAPYALFLWFSAGVTILYSLYIHASARCAGPVHEK